MQFRKKPVVVEAEQYDGNNNPFGAIKQHQCDYRMCPVCGGDNQPHNYITTMHDGQSVVVVPGDWIIPDGKPETFYPCKPDIFAKTYEPADSAPRLQEAAECDAVEFANFIGDRALPEYSKSENLWRWWNNKGSYSTATTEELYTLFITRPAQTKQ